MNIDNPIKHPLRGSLIREGKTTEVKEASRAQKERVDTSEAAQKLRSFTQINLLLQRYHSPHSDLQPVDISSSTEVTLSCWSDTFAIQGEYVPSAIDLYFLNLTFSE